MSRTFSGPRAKGLALLPEKGDRLCRMATEIGWQVDRRAKNVVIISPSGHRITMPYDPDHPDWNAKVLHQTRSTGLVEAYQRHQEGSQRVMEDQALADFLRSAGEAFSQVVEVPSETATGIKSDGRACETCGMDFSTAQRLGSHRFRVHGIKGTSGSALARQRDGGADPVAAAQTGAPAAVFQEPSTVIASPKPRPPLAAAKPAASPETVQEAPAEADEMKDVRSAMQMLQDEFQAVLERARANAPDPAVIQERDDLKAQVETLEFQVKGSLAENDRLINLVTDQVAELETNRADTKTELEKLRTEHTAEIDQVRADASEGLDKLQKRVSSLDAELQQLRGFWSFVVGLMDGNTAPNKAYNLISSRVIEDAEG